MKLKKYIALVAAILMAAGSLSACSNEDQENQDAYRKIGINSMAEGDYNKAIKSFQKALDTSLGEVGPEEIDICYYKAAAQFANGDDEDAIKTYTALIDYDEDNAQVYYLRGSVYLNQKQEKKALEDYEKAVEVGEEDYDIYIGIYENLKNSGYEEEAEEYLRKAVENKPKETEDYAKQGHIYYLLGDYKQAKARLDKAIDQDSKEALLYLAEVYNAEDQTEQAKGLLENYVKDNAEDSEALNTLGMMLLNNEQYEDALKYFQMGIKLKDAPNRQELMKNEIATYEYMGEFESARDKMEAYLKEYKNDEEAVREYTFLKTR